MICLNLFLEALFLFLRLMTFEGCFSEEGQMLCQGKVEVSLFLLQILPLPLQVRLQTNSLGLQEFHDWSILKLILSAFKLVAWILQAAEVVFPVSSLESLLRSLLPLPHPLLHPLQSLNADHVFSDCSPRVCQSLVTLSSQILLLQSYSSVP